MKRWSVPPLAVVCLAVATCLTGQAGASDWAGSSYYSQDGYAAISYPAGYGGCAGHGGVKVKVHGRHGPMGYGCPIAGGSCSYVYGYATSCRHVHRYHVWRTGLLPCSAAGYGIYGPTFFDPTPARPQTGMPTEPVPSPGSLQPQSPAPPVDSEPRSIDNEPILPGDDSSP